MLAAMPPTPAPRPDRPGPPVRDRGDACPGALRLHSAADGSLARVRLPAGDLTVRQAHALADAADRLGDGRLSLTSRGNVELRGLPDDCGQDLTALLADAGLLPSVRHERIRNVLASPLAGLDRHTPSDVRLWARSLDALLCASEPARALSGRFLFVLDDGRGDVAGLGGDVTLLAESARRAPADTAYAPGAASGYGALLRVGDERAVLRIAADDVPRAALTAAEVFLAAAAERGNGAWRVRELPAARPLTAREVARALRAAGITAEYADPSDPGPVVPYADATAPGAVEGPDGRRAIVVLAPLGRLSVAQWRLLAGIADDDGHGALRLTPWRGIVVPGLPTALAARRLTDLAAAGLVTDPDSPWRRVTACTGLPGCAKSRRDVRSDAAAALSAGRPVPADGSEVPVGLPVHWSGCERRCGHPHGAWIDALATAEGYRTTAVGPNCPPPPPVSRETPRAGTVSRETAAPAPVSRETPPPPGAPPSAPAPSPSTPQPTNPRPQ
ncbi:MULTISPECIES: precorrin-3B synthase [unclassified Streptomyces]|uniref:precorrin-3B synthase n=1 Tax=unclassified Streptomyces TaxID=2593676 RepID=UPI000372BEB4|nr:MULTISPECIES: precorrin-3B synthase [unclassified Streptomyces]MYT32830.1 precorrin-3B synthase [Streptomyces sp. SID8354]